MSSYLNGLNSSITVTGNQKAPTTCLLQRLLNQVQLRVNLSSGASASSTLVSRLYIGNADSSGMNVGASYSLANSDVYGQLPPISFVVANEVTQK